MKTTTKHLFFFLMLLLAGQARAQLSGTVNVPSTSYPNMNAVVNALNLQGVGVGGVIININTTQYAPNGGYMLGSNTLNASTSAINSITIEGNRNNVISNVG